MSAEHIGGVGSVLVDAKGQVLYASDQETGGKVLCTGACTSFWTPLTVAGTPTAHALPGTLGATTRPDGTRQVTYNGRLLYSFVQDRPGQVSGDGFSDVFAHQHFTWHVVHGDNATSSTSGTTTESSGPGGY